MCSQIQNDQDSDSGYARTKQNVNNSKFQDCGLKVCATPISKCLKFLYFVTELTLTIIGSSFHQTIKRTGCYQVSLSDLSYIWGWQKRVSCTVKGKKCHGTADKLAIRKGKFGIRMIKVSVFRFYYHLDSHFEFPVMVIQNIYYIFWITNTFLKNAC